MLFTVHDVLVYSFKFLKVKSLKEVSHFEASMLDTILEIISVGAWR